MKEAEDRFCIVINGDSRTGKTKLAQLIIRTLSASKLISNERSYIFWKQQDLSDKLPRLNS
jgi:uridine kinase